MTQKGDNNKKSKKKKRRIFKKVFLTLLTVILVCSVAIAGVVFAIIKTGPALDVKKILYQNETSKIYDNNKEMIDIVITERKRTEVSLKDMSPYITKGIVSIEDERFYKHKGVDPIRIVGVVISNIKNKLTNKSGVQGASTITQQLLKNTILTDEASYTRKIREAYMALKLEKDYLSKDQILEAYLNTVNFGGNYYGVETASLHYFSKSAKDLNLIEGAFLSGVTQNPEKFYPFSAKALKNPEPYITRTKLVLSKMLETGAISKEEYDKALKEVNEKGITFNKSVKDENKMRYEWFSLPVIEEVKKDLKQQQGLSDSEIKNLLMTGGIKIFTTMDKKIQDETEKVINDDSNYELNNPIDNIKQPQASAVIMDYRTGEVKAIVGGRGDQPPRSFNRAAYNGSKAFLKPPGSSFKPIAVYSPALDSKDATAATVVEDSPLSPEIGKLYPMPDGTPYNPSNYETGRYMGYMTIREAIERSQNLVAVKLEHEIGIKTGKDYASKFGITTVNSDGLASMSLGQLTQGTNTLSMTAAYGVFGNGGLYTKPRLYTKVEDRDGRVLLETKPETHKVLTPQSAYIMYDMLKGPVSGANGTARIAKFSDMPAAGKTGTSSFKENFWFCGLTPYYCGAIWIGNDAPKTYDKGISSWAAARMWGIIMKDIHKALPVKDIEEPSNIVRVNVCKVSGKLPTDLCKKDPRGDETYTELFIAGTEPTTFCDIHVEAKVNKLNNKLATEATPLDLIVSKVFIKRDYIPSKPLDDQAYVLPTEKDDTTSTTKHSNGNNGSLIDNILNLFNKPNRP